MLLARETACLSRADRAEVDRRVAGDPDVLEAMGDGEIVARAREARLRAGPGLVRRTTPPRRGRPTRLPAAGSRRDEPALRAAAGQGRRRRLGGARPRGRPGPSRGRPALARPDHGRHPGAPRPQTPGQRTARHRAADDQRRGPRLGAAGRRRRIRLGASTTARSPATCSASGSPPTPRQGVDQWVRRLYATPATGELVAMDSKSRRFEGSAGRLPAAARPTCRTRYCDAPVRHLDHAKAHADGGPTAARQRPRALRDLQLRQGRPRLVSEAATRTPAHHRDRDPDRSPLPQHRTADDGCRARTAGARWTATCSRLDVRDEHQERALDRALGVDVEVQGCSWICDSAGRFSSRASRTTPGARSVPRVISSYACWQMSAISSSLSPRFRPRRNHENP